MQSCDLMQPLESGHIVDRGTGYLHLADSFGASDDTFSSFHRLAYLGKDTPRHAWLHGDHSLLVGMG